MRGSPAAWHGRLAEGRGEVTSPLPRSVLWRRATAFRVDVPSVETDGKTRQKSASKPASR